MNNNFSYVSVVNIKGNNPRTLFVAATHSEAYKGACDVILRYYRRNVQEEAPEAIKLYDEGFYQRAWEAICECGANLPEITVNELPVLTKL